MAPQQGDDVLGLARPRAMGAGGRGSSERKQQENCSGAVLTRRVCVKQESWLGFSVTWKEYVLKRQTRKLSQQRPHSRSRTDLPQPREPPRGRRRASAEKLRE